MYSGLKNVFFTHWQVWVGIPIPNFFLILFCQFFPKLGWEHCLSFPIQKFGNWIFHSHSPSQNLGIGLAISHSQSKMHSRSCLVGDRQTNAPVKDIATYRLNRLRGRCSENQVLVRVCWFINLLVFIFWFILKIIIIETYEYTIENIYNLVYFCFKLKHGFSRGVTSKESIFGAQFDPNSKSHNNHVIF